MEGVPDWYLGHHLLHRGGHSGGCVLGIILGIILVAGEEDGVRPLPGPVMKVLNFAINILRSVPFLILMIMVLPLE